MHGGKVNTNQCLSSESHELIQPKLRKDLLKAIQEIASGQFAHERVNHTLQATALVNELWLRILRSEEEPPINAVAFKAWAATAIRNILISHARATNAIKRGGLHQRVLLQTNHGSKSNACIDLLELEDELNLLKDHNPRAAEVVKLRLYGGMEHREIAEVLGISERLSQKSWAMARSWLSIRLQNV